MNKIVSVLLAALFVVSLAGPAWAIVEARIGRGGYYLAVRSGVSMPSDILFISAVDPDSSDVDVSFKEGQENAAALGLSFWDGKVELEYATLLSEVDEIDGSPVSDVTFDVTTLMANGYYEWPALGNLFYYLGAGIGVVNLMVDLAGEEEEIQRLAYRFKAGLVLDLGKSMSMNIGYSYLWSSDFSLETTQGEFFSNFTGHSAKAGVSLYF